MSDLATRHCVPCEGGVPPLSPDQARAQLCALNARWKLAEDHHALVADIEFSNYFRTLAFVNAVAYIAITEDHHPDLAFGYRSVHIHYTTHAIHGLSDNDFICAAKVDALLQI